MIDKNKIWIASSDQPIYMIPQMANRHGLIAGATGTGKTITLKVMAESFSDLGVPVFLSDVKSDLSGMCQPGKNSDNMQERIKYFGINNWQYKSFPTHYWDIFGEVGHPIRVTVSEMGPVLLGKLLGLTDVQEGVLAIVFRVADDAGYLMDDLKDLRAMLAYVGEHKEDYTMTYGNVSTASIGAIQRALLQLEDEGGDIFFGLPSFEITDWMRTDSQGKGYINILNSTRLIQSPTLYSTFLLWMLSELYERLPEVGDLDKPRMIFFFDEAHLLFKDCPPALVQKVVQIVKLIRSKGVGIYFISQSPSDIPDEVLAQLSHRIQHALRAFTPAEQKAVKVVAQTFRQNPAFKVEEIIGELKVGEALVSCLDEDGAPGIVQRARILPPQSLMGPNDEAVVKQTILASEFELKYRKTTDRMSAFESLQQVNAQEQEQEETEKQLKDKEKEEAKAKAAAEKEKAKKDKQKTDIAKKTLNSATSSVSRSISSSISRSIMGGKSTSPEKIIQRAATNALSTFLRESGKSITRGLFGTKK